MSGNSNVAHVSSVDKGLKMKIKRTKVPNKVDPKHEVVKAGLASQNVSALSSSTASSLLSTSSTSSSSSSSCSSSTSPQTSGSGPSISSVSLPMTSINSVSSTLSSSSSSSFASSSLSTMSSFGSSSVSPSNPSVTQLKPPSGCGEAMSSSLMGSMKSPSKMPANLGAPVIEIKDGKSPKSKAAYGKKLKDAKFKGDPSVLPSGSSICSVTGSNSANMEGRILTSSSPGLTGPGQSFSTVMPNSSLSGSSGGSGVLAPSMTSEPRPGDTVYMKKENPVHDPYEFNAKVEDKIELPPKKLKLDKVENMECATSPQPPHHLSSPSTTSSLPSSGSTHSAFQSPHHHHHHNHHHQQQQQPHHPQQQQQQHQQQQQQAVVPQKHHVAVDACNVGMVTEPDCLGPCEPGTSVGLEGIVWKETDNGLLVVNVTWRGKTYVGTLMDATRYAWAPPRPSGCESPTSDFESRTPKGRGKRTSRNSVQANEKLPEGRRLRKGRRGTAGNFTAPASPAKSDINAAKRKAKGNDVESNEKAKRSKPFSRCTPDAESPTTDGYIVCPEPNCHKKYKHMNGLRYHRTHAHRKSSVNDDAKDEEEEEEDEEEEEKPEKKEKITNVSERAERMKAKEKLRLREQRNSSRDSKDSLDDDIPLKEIATKANNQTKTTPSASEEGHKEDVEDTDENIKYNNNSYAVTLNNKNDPQVVLHKTPIPNAKEVVSSGFQNAGKKSDGHNPDLSSSSTSTPSTFVPSVSSNSESNVSPLVNSNASSNTNMPVMTTLKSPITSQIYQISPTGSLGGVSLISQGISTLSVVTTQTLPLMSSSIGQTPTCLSTSSSTSSSTSPSVVSTDKQGNKIGNMKGVLSSRPVVSTLSSQITGMNGPHVASMPSMSPGQSSSLKPIQPKPSQMVEYSDVSQARKNKKKEVAGPFTSSNTPSKLGTPGKDLSSAVINLAHEESPRVERSAVIKANVTPSRTLDGSDLPSISHLEIPKSSNTPFPSSHDSPNMPMVVTSDASQHPGSRLAVPPNSLALGSTVHNSVDRNNSPANDDVHSPAYSDISDANDSNSPPQQDSPSKKDSSGKRDGTANGPQHIGPDGTPLSQHYGNMYYFQGAPNYLPQMSSPTLAKNPSTKKEGLEENRPSSSNEEGDKKDAPRPLNPQEVDIQQKNLINYIHMHSFLPPELQFRYNLPGYGQHPIDSYTAQMLQDPIHRQQLAEHQKRLLQQQQQQQDLSSGKPEESHFKGYQFPGASQGRVFVDNNGKPVMSNSGAFNSAEGILDSKKMGEDFSQGLREKPSESNPFSKENIELKSPADGHQDFQQQSQIQANFQLMKQHQQHQSHNILRAQMYPHQQKPKIYDNRQDKRKMQPEITNSNLLPQGHGQQPLSGRRIDGIKSGELIPHDSIKKEIIPGKDIVRTETKVSNLDNKRFEIKEEVRCPSRPSSSSVDSNKGRPPSQSNPSNIPVGNLQGPLASQSASSASALSIPSPSVSLPSSSSTPVPSSLAPTIPHTAISGAAPFPYSSFYPSHFRPMHVDATHPMYRSLNPHIIGFAGAPPGTYIHPPQLGYRLPTVDGEVKAGIPDGVESLKINPDVGGPVHKIHELQEKGRPSPGVHSPAPPSKSAADVGRPSSRTSSPASTNSKDKQRDYANSPPTQRHVHTHHHTHVVGGFPPLYAPEAYNGKFG